MNGLNKQEVVCMSEMRNIYDMQYLYCCDPVALSKLHVTEFIAKGWTTSCILAEGVVWLKAIKTAASVSLTVIVAYLN